MKLFISWSKETSHRVALVLRDWLPVIVPSVDPWVSSEDIAKGTRGRDVVVKELAGTGQGVICLTRENVREPWLNFEAGALSNHPSEPRVRTVLFDLKPSDVVGPLSDFQHTDLNDRDDVSKLINSINDASESKLSEKQLSMYLDSFWDRFVSGLSEIRESMSRLPVGDDGAAPRSQEQVVEEVLDRVRVIERTQRQMASRLTSITRSIEQVRDSIGLLPGPGYIADADIEEVSRIDSIRPATKFVAHPDMGAGEILSIGPNQAEVRFGKRVVLIPLVSLEQVGRFESLAEAKRYHQVHAAEAAPYLRDDVDDDS